jgi:hypothetical protein
MNVRARYLSTTMVLLALAAAYAAIQATQTRSVPQLRSSLASANRPATPPSPPVSARMILERRADLGVTAEQAARFEALDHRWRQETKSLVASLEEVEREFARFMAAQGPRNAPLPEIQRQSAEFRELSAELRERRLRHATAATDLLTAAQRQRLDATSSPSANPGDIR